jgi:hypothetical protein
VSLFERDLQITFAFDPLTVDPEAIGVFFFDETTRSWVQVPTIIDHAGFATFMTNHLSRYALFEMDTVEQTLAPGLNAMLFTGATGTRVQDLADRIGPDVESVLRYDAAQQRWDVWIPGAPAFASKSFTLDQRDAMYVRLGGQAVQTITTTDVVPPPNLQRLVTLHEGLNHIGVTRTGSVAIEAFAAKLGSHVRSIWRFDTLSNSWERWIAGAPDHLNTLVDVDRLDVLVIDTDATFSVELFDMLVARSVGP